MIALINIVVLMTMLGHRKYQYLFCRENQGKITCPHECPLINSIGLLQNNIEAYLKENYPFPNIALFK